MGIGNDSVMSGHVSLGLYWSDKHGHHHHARPLNTVPLVFPQPAGWLRHYDRGATVVGKSLRDTLQSLTATGKKWHDDPKVKTAVTILNDLKAAFQAAGMPDKVVDWSLIQDYMESGAFTNKGYRNNNNPGSIMYSKHDPYATRGTYNTINKDYYAKYKDLAQYAKAKMRVLSLHPGRPIDATDNADFVHRLKLNNYFGKQSEASYFNALKGAAQRINLLKDFEDDTHQNIVVPDKKPFPWWGYALIGVGGVIVIKNLV